MAVRLELTDVDSAFVRALIAMAIDGFVVRSLLSARGDLSEESHCFPED